MATPSTLDIARRMLKSAQVAKAEGADPDPRAEGASPTEEELEAAKKEAQAGAAAGGPDGASPDGGTSLDGESPDGPTPAPADPSGVAPSGDEPPDEDKREVAKAITDLMASSGLSWEQIGMLSAGADSGPAGAPVKKSSGEGSFSGGEREPGDPKSDFGGNKAQEQLDEILAQLRKQGKVQEDLQKQVEELVTARGEVAKAEGGLRDALAAFEARLAVAETTSNTISAALGALPRTAPALAPKSIVAKAEGSDSLAMPMVGNTPIPYRTHQELMKACLEGKVDPSMTPAYTRAISVFHQQSH